jgi:hypothetical protein
MRESERGWQAFQKLPRENATFVAIAEQQLDAVSGGANVQHGDVVRDDGLTATQA